MVCIFSPPLITLCLSLSLSVSLSVTRYGSFKNFSQFCFRKIRLNEKCLVIGCGNSAFSSDLYDHGFKNITNIDFSEQVIRSMQEINLPSRPEMSWEVMDMTAMTYEEGSYDVIIDKGALDALMSANTLQAKQQALDMFESINRVLKDKGRYLCITLAEDFILQHLLGHFTQIGTYTTQIFTIHTETPSPFKTFVILITKQTRGEDQRCEVFFDSFGVPYSFHQTGSPLTLEDTLEMVKLSLSSLTHRSVFPSLSFPFCGNAGSTSSNILSKAFRSLDCEARLSS
jgi:ubiquinone/menaquinone biosynthesis C-methylase UbiE